MINYDYKRMLIGYFLRLSVISIQKNQTTGARDTLINATACGICCCWISVRESANIVLIPYAIPINTNVIAIAAITTIINSFAFITVCPALKRFRLLTSAGSGCNKYCTQYDRYKLSGLHNFLFLLSSQSIHYL